MSPERSLGEYEHSVLGDFEHAAAPLQQLHAGFWKSGSNLGRQTGGPRFVVSNDAVTDGDDHDSARSEGKARSDKHES
jgi:hypothetical protein